MYLQLDRESCAPAAHRNLAGKEMMRRLEDNPGLVADREPVPGEVGKILVAASSVPRTVLRTEDKRLDLVLKQLHNCGRCDTVEPY